MLNYQNHIAIASNSIIIEHGITSTHFCYFYYCDLKVLFNELQRNNLVHSYEPSIIYYQLVDQILFIINLYCKIL